MLALECFNIEIKKQIKKLLDSNDNFNLILLYGDLGNGKTYIAHKALSERKIDVTDIIFSGDYFFPRGLMSDEEWIESDEHSILSACTRNFHKENCIFFQNMEYCNLDYLSMFSRMLRYYKSINARATVIIEYNGNRLPNNDFCKLTDKKIGINSPKPEIFDIFLEKNFHYNDLNGMLFQKIKKISTGSVRTFYTVLNILQHLDIISMGEDDKYDYKKVEFEMPNNFLELQNILFGELAKYEANPLLVAAPFSINIYEKLLTEVFSEFDSLEKYLDNLSQYKSFITRDDSFQNTQLFQSSYAFLDNEAQEAILTQLERNEIRKKIAAYYTYFDKIYQNKTWYNSLKDADRVLLLSNLARVRQNTMGINQVRYFVDLMEYYYEHFLYHNVIELACTVIKSKELTSKQINAENHLFWIIYFKSLIAVGKYKQVIEYNEQFADNDLNYLIAKALYYKGEPEKALYILEKKISDKGDANFNIGYKYSILSSIYDWLGDNKKSKRYFRLAIKNAREDDLQYQLYKKYSQQIDFAVPECQEKMKKAIDFYANRSMKDYAECLHNFGTSCIFVKEYKEADEKLKLSCNILNKMCANEIYYPLNSLGILYCYNNSEYEKAVSIWEFALKFHINEKFCEAAIINNIMNIYIKIGEYKKAKEKMDFFKRRFIRYNSSANMKNKSRLDMSHQLRQYYYNIALYFKAKGDFKEAIKYFYKAGKTSTYESNIVYSINKNILDLENHLKQTIRFSKQKHIKVEAPTPIEKYMHEQNMYLCEIMFWG